MDYVTKKFFNRWRGRFQQRTDTRSAALANFPGRLQSVFLRVWIHRLRARISRREKFQAFISAVWTVMAIRYINFRRTKSLSNRIHRETAFLKWRARLRRSENGRAKRFFRLWRANAQSGRRDRLVKVAGDLIRIESRFRRWYSLFIKRREGRLIQRVNRDVVLRGILARSLRKWIAKTRSRAANYEARATAFCTRQLQLRSFIAWNQQISEFYDRAQRFRRMGLARRFIRAWASFSSVKLDQRVHFLRASIIHRLQRKAFSRFVGEWTKRVRPMADPAISLLNGKGSTPQITKIRYI
jgi:hypothetical protein